ncbi:DUF3307 domain-containing protein [Parvibaculum sp.]|uniref:DUF3307 domain-containing protein n=1 Tax=Parvibaculum sp. TaxID=2024848 RepID=UPI00320EE74C
MSSPLLTLLGGLVLFQLKHFLFDFVFQTNYQLKNKGTYAHPGGILHAGLHAAGSLPAIFLFGPSATLVMGLVVAEFVIHYHMDWLKERVVRVNGLTNKDATFWHIFGLDQLIHNLTYTGMLIVLLTRG